MVYIEKLLSLFLPGHRRTATISRGERSERLLAVVCLAGMMVGLHPMVCAADSSNNDSLRLSMISGDGKRLLATINGETFAVGEKHRVTVGGRKVVVQCLDIRESSAVVQVAGEATAKELSFGRRAKALAATSPLVPTQPAQAMVVEPEETPEQSLPGAVPVRLSAIVSLISLGTLLVIFVLYVAFCRSCRTLCRRAGAPSVILVWLPGLQYFPLFKAAGVSRWWLLVPFANFIAWIVCCVRLCDTFHVSRALVVLMLLPLFDWMAFIYLARTSSQEDQGPAVRQKFAFEVPGSSE